MNVHVPCATGGVGPTYASWSTSAIVSSKDSAFVFVHSRKGCGSKWDWSESQESTTPHLVCNLSPLYTSSWCTQSTFVLYFFKESIHSVIVRTENIPDKEMFCSALMDLALVRHITALCVKSLWSRILDQGKTTMLKKGGLGYFLFWNKNKELLTICWLHQETKPTSSNHLVSVNMTIPFIRDVVLFRALHGKAGYKPHVRSFTPLDVLLLEQWGKLR